MRKYFYCHNPWDMHGRRPITEIAQELDGKYLCGGCHALGFRLVRGVTVKLIKKKEAGK